jgi:hypothetical protein
MFLLSAEMQQSLPGIVASVLSTSAPQAVKMDSLHGVANRLIRVDFAGSPQIRFETARAVLLVVQFAFCVVEARADGSKRSFRFRIGGSFDVLLHSMITLYGRIPS